MPDFGSDAIDDALDDDLPEVDTDETDEPDTDEIDAALDGPGDTADTDDAPDTADGEAETDATDATDDDLTVEPTDEIDDSDPDSDGMPRARQRRRPPRRQRRAWRETDGDDHEATDTPAGSDDAPAADELVDARLDELTADGDDSDPAEPPTTYDNDDEPTLTPETQTLSAGYGPANTDRDDTDATRGTSTVTASGEVWPEPPDGRPTTEALGVASLWLPLAALAFVLAGPAVAVPVAAVWMVVSLPVLIASTGGREPEATA
jgi:hypothetical protein